MSPWGALASGTLLREPIVLTPFAAPGGVGAFGVSIKPTTLVPDARVRDWPLILLWLVVLFLSGWLLLEQMGSRSSRLLDDLDLHRLALGLLPIGLAAIAVGLRPGLIGVAEHPSFGWRQIALVAFGGSAVLAGLTIVRADWRRRQNARRIR